MDCPTPLNVNPFSIFISDGKCKTLLAHAR